MKLSELRQGTPIRIKAFENGRKCSEIWGKIRKNTQNRCQIDVYYYEGKNIDLNSSAYTVEAVAFDHGKELPIEWMVQSAADMRQTEDTLEEQRESFRIYIGIPVDGVVGGKEEYVLLMDASENGFRIICSNASSLVKDTYVTVHVDDEGFDFHMDGVVIWGKQNEAGKSMYGCRILTEYTDISKLKEYIQLKQQKLLKELTEEIGC